MKNCKKKNLNEDEIDVVLDENLETLFKFLLYLCLSFWLVLGDVQCSWSTSRCWPPWHAWRHRTAQSHLVKCSTYVYKYIIKNLLNPPRHDRPSFTSNFERDVTTCLEIVDNCFNHLFIIRWKLLWLETNLVDLLTCEGTAFRRSNISRVESESLSNVRSCSCKP